jgi:hypothetical protein
MKVRTVLAAVGLGLSVASFSPPVFAQAGGAGAGAAVGGGGAGAGIAGATSGMPAGSPSGLFQSAPSAGQPGTQAPASAAPIGASTSDWMSHDGRSIAEHSSPIFGPQDTELETRLRAQETTLEREIAAYRASGYTFPAAMWEKWLGSEALGRGDRVDAANHFQNAATDLRRSLEAGQYARESNRSDATLHGNQTSQMTNAANIHSEKSSRSVY